MNFVRQMFSLRHGKTELGEKFRLPGKKANAGDSVLLRLRQLRPYQKLTAACTLMRGIDRDRPDFRQVQPIKMKRAVSPDATDVLQHNEVSDVLANFRKTARKQRAITRVIRDQLMNSFRIRENRLTRAHACSPARDCT